MKEYKVVMVKEGGVSTIVFGTGKLPLERIEQTLNEYARENWSLQFMIIEKRRLFWLLEREVAIITLARNAMTPSNLASK